MVKLVFVEDGGAEHEVECASGTTLMRAAVEHGIDGILADCGGNAQCATCHVFVDPADLERLPPIRTAEDEMLDATAVPRRPNSRLSCQIILTNALDHLRVTLPATQI